MGVLDFVKDFLSPKDKETLSGVYNSKEQLRNFYLMKLAISTSIGFIASAISKSEIKVYENNDIVKNVDYFSLNYNPNVNENSSRFWHKVVERLFFDGEALVINKNGNLICADSFVKEVEDPVKGDMFSDITSGNYTFNEVFSIKDVYLFKLSDENIKKLLEQFIVTYQELLSCSFEMYKKKMNKKYKLKISNMQTGDADFQAKYQEYINTQVNDFLKSDNAVLPEFEGVNLEKLQDQNSYEDSVIEDFLKLKNDIFETVATAFKIPSTLLTGSRTATTKTDEDMKAFVTFAVNPITEMIGEELTRKLGFDNWKKGNFYEIDTSRLSHLDIYDLIKVSDKIISSTIFSPNEARALLGYVKLDDEWANKHFMTKNFDFIDNIEKGLQNE